MPNNTVERLAGAIARDFDQLLTTIVGRADRLGEFLSPGDPRAVEVAAIRQAAEHACELTQQLLTFSRTRALRPRVVDLNAMIGRARYTLQRAVGDHIRVEFSLAADARRVHLDAEHLQQILYNLTLSARDAMPDGGLLGISTRNVLLAPADAQARDLEPGEYVTLSVTDSGAPIDSSVQPHLFEPFSDGAVQRRGGGGLGLAIVEGVVKESGGRVEIESPVTHSGGTRFVVLLPAADEGASPSVDGDRQSSGRETIVVAADDPNLQALIVAVLRRRGYGVLGAPDRSNALRLANSHEDEIGLLITTTTADGRLIGDGFRVARPETRVLFVGAPAADCGEGFANEALLTQPFTPAALARKIRGLLTAPRVHLEMRVLP
jgi:two-component system, cell cycle sensor histidine kinase and response regulator CckA